MTVASCDMTWSSVVWGLLDSYGSVARTAGNLSKTTPTPFFSQNDSLFYIIALHHILLTCISVSLTRCHPIYSHLSFREGRGGAETGGSPSQFHMSQLAKSKKKASRQCGSQDEAERAWKSRWGNDMHGGTAPFPTQPLCILEILNRPHTVLHFSVSSTFSASFLNY